MIRTERRLRLCLALIVLNICFIWGNSLLPGELSGAFSDWVKNLLANLFSGGDSGTSGGLIRKLAHFSEFAMLGMLLSWLFGMLQKNLLWPFVLGFFTASMDETIQRFVPNRGPSVWDVLLDTSGVLVGMLVLYAGYTVMKKRTNLSMEETKQ
jgi:VanZ family protein